MNVLFPGKAEVVEERQVDVPGEVTEVADMQIEARIPMFCMWHGHAPWWYLPSEHAENYVGGWNAMTPSTQSILLKVLFASGFVILAIRVLVHR